MEQALQTLLRGSTALISLVPAASINWGAHVQGGEKPYIVLSTISEVPVMHMQGQGGLSSYRVQFDCYGTQYRAVAEVRNALKALLSGYRAGSFRLIEYAGSRDDRESGTNEAERLHRASLDFIINWSTEL